MLLALCLFKFSSSTKKNSNRTKHDTDSIFFKGMDYDEQLRESVMQNEVFARHVQILRSEVGEDFEAPPGRSFRMVLNGELVSALNFDHSYGSSLCIHYFLDLPLGWTIATDNGEESGITQFSEMRYQDDVSHFSHPFSLDLHFDINRLDQQDTLPTWPKLCFEVISTGNYKIRLINVLIRLLIFP